MVELQSRRIVMAGIKNLKKGKLDGIEDVL